MNDTTVIAGKRLRQARHAQKLSMRDLQAKACLSSPSVVSRAEQGFNTTFTTMVAMAAALGVSLDALIAPTVCIICDGMPPAGFTCLNCGNSHDPA